MTKNLGLKLFSLLLAIMLAYVVNSQRNTSVASFVAPVEVKNVRSSKILISPLKREVRVSVRGPSFLVGPIASAPPPIKVKVPEDANNRYVATFTSADLPLSSAIEVLQIEPPELELIFDDRESKHVKVDVPRSGRLKDDLRIDNIEISPSEVEVSGPASDIRDISTLQTNPLDLRELSGSDSIDLLIRSPGPLVNLSDRQVHVSFEITTIREERHFDERAVELRGIPGSPTYDLEPRNVDVVVIGPREVIRNLAPSEIVPFVRISDGNETASLAVDVQLPQQVKLVSVTPSQVRVSNVHSGVIKKSKGK